MQMYIGEPGFVHENIWMKAKGTKELKATMSLDCMYAVDKLNGWMAKIVCRTYACVQVGRLLGKRDMLRTKYHIHIDDSHKLLTDPFQWCSKYPSRPSRVPWCPCL